MTMSPELRGFWLEGCIAPGVPGVSVREMEKAWGRADHFKPRSTLSKFAWYGKRVFELTASIQRPLVAAFCAAATGEVHSEKAARSVQAGMKTRLV
ncbi:MAG: hypothetical protein JSS51_08850 [Planctomycetes bacterium]|nr:hypothetical protein [Planctomycetota bacterium]